MESNEKEKVTTKHEKALRIWPIVSGVLFGLAALGCIVWLFVNTEWTAGAIIVVAVLVTALIFIIAEAKGK